MPEDHLVHVFHDGTVYLFNRSETHSSSFFGGPLEQKLTGIPHGPRALHHVANLSEAHLPFLGYPRYVFDIPLIYGFCFDGCFLKYRVKRPSGKVDIFEMGESASSDDFPYRNYPDLLPYVPLTVALTERSSYCQFAERFYNMPEDQPAELVAVVPAPSNIGMSLWGRWGESTSVVFECDLDNKVVHAYNVCD